MQGTQYRCLILIAVLATSWGLLSTVDKSEAASARWPAEDAPFAVDGWVLGRESVESPWHGVHFVTRHYVHPEGITARLTLKTHPEAKQLYRTGAEVAFLGGGYTVEPAPSGVVPPAAGREALLVRREDQLWLLLHTYGERRGLLGNGALAWSLAVLDGVLGRPNDYYQLSLVVPLSGPDSPAVQQATALADTLFPRLAGWYAD
jgi:hypothetical protein